MKTLVITILIMSYYIYLISIERKTLLLNNTIKLIIVSIMLAVVYYTIHPLMGVIGIIGTGILCYTYHIKKQLQDLLYEIYLINPDTFIQEIYINSPNSRRYNILELKEYFDKR